MANSTKILIVLCLLLLVIFSGTLAAAGNDGNTRHSYPASYRDVISVAAVDENKDHAILSQRPNLVELVAPEVHVFHPFLWGLA